MDTLPTPSNAAQAQTPRTPQTAIEVVEAFLAAGSVKDIERCSALLHDDAVGHLPPFPPQRGKQKIEKSLRLFFQIPGTFDIHVHNIAERNGIVLTERTDSIRGGWFDFDFWVCGTFEVRDGKIALWRDYFDLSAFTLKALAGPIPALIRAAQKQWLAPKSAST